ncbi:MAG: hypothetical protein ACOC1U_10825 [Spirochaetota bacterium]
MNGSRLVRAPRSTPRSAPRPLRWLLSHLVLAGALLAAGAIAAAADSVATESATVALTPDEGLVTRILLRPHPSARFVLVAEARDDVTPMAGGSLGVFTGGPVILRGGLAALSDPLRGGPTSRTWREPSGLALDTSLAPTRRLGLALRTPGAGAVAWVHNEAIAHAVVLGGERAVRSPPLGSGLPRHLLAEAIAMHVRPVSGERSIPDGWFASEPPPAYVSYLLGRASAAWALVRVGVEGALSVPPIALPGFWVRTHLALAPLRGLSVHSRFVLVSPDSREGLSGARTGAAVELALAGELSNRLITLSAGTALAADAAEERYASVGIPWRQFGPASDRYEAALRINVPDEVPFLRSISLAGELATRPQSVRELDVDARLVTGLLLPDRLEATIRVVPSVTLSDTDPLATRLAAELVCSAPAISRATKGGWELASGVTIEWEEGSEAVFTWRVRFSVERVTAPE